MMAADTFFKDHKSTINSFLLIDNVIKSDIKINNNNNNIILR
jgi:hypothetical protein